VPLLRRAADVAALAAAGVHLGRAADRLGAGLWITALTVKYRDFRFITPFMLQIGMFVTPVGYRTDFLPNWRDLLALNPLTGVVDGFRWCLLGGTTEFYVSPWAGDLVLPSPR
jgi:ABC-type polysaccharide/polyol phosphate export permease